MQAVMSNNRIFELRLPWIKVKIAAYFKSRWSKQDWFTGLDFNHKVAFEVGVNYYRGLDVRNKPNAYPRDYIFYLTIKPLVSLVVPITYNYRNEVVLTIDDQQDDEQPTKV